MLTLCGRTGAVHEDAGDFGDFLFGVADEYEAWKVDTGSDFFCVEIFKLSISS
jgi:hypothetical protein